MVLPRVKTVVKNPWTTALIISGIPTKPEGNAKGTSSQSGLVWFSLRDDQAGMIIGVMWDQGPP